MKTWELKDLLVKFERKFPLPQIQSGENIPQFEERCRAWTLKFAQQTKFSTKDEGYCCKRADPTRPLSKDVLAHYTGEEFVGWDLMSGASTGFPRLQAENPTRHDLSGQTPVLVVAIDWLQEGTVPPPTPPQPPQPSDLEQRLANLEQKFRGLGADLEDVLVWIRSF